MPCLCSFNCCFLTLSHSVHEPSSLFLGWALTRCSEKELGAGLLHVDVMWSLERSLQGLAPGTEASTLKSGCSNSLLQKAARAQQWEAQTPLTPQPSRCPPCPSYPPDHSQPHALTSLLIQLETPSAPTQAGSLCTHCGAMLRPVLAVTGSNGERQRGACRAQQTPAQQPHRGRGRNILASVIDGLDIAFRQSLPSQISPRLQNSYRQQIGEFFCTYIRDIRRHSFHHREIQLLRY